MVMVTYLPMLWRIAVRPAWLVPRGSFLALAFWLVVGVKGCKLCIVVLSLMGG
jgi:hypothetical protein